MRRNCSFQSIKKAECRIGDFLVSIIELQWEANKRANVKILITLRITEERWKHAHPIRPQYKHPPSHTLMWEGGCCTQTSIVTQLNAGGQRIQVSYCGAKEAWNEPQWQLMHGFINKWRDPQIHSVTPFKEADLNKIQCFHCAAQAVVKRPCLPSFPPLAYIQLKRISHCLILLWEQVHALACP